MIQTPPKRSGHAYGTRSSLMRGAIMMLLLAAACTTRPARAEASVDATCAAEAAAEFERIVNARGVADAAAVIEAGCDDADLDAGLVCAVRGSVGPCSAKPACPENQISSSGCTPANEDAGCCIESFRKACDGCEPVLTQCFNLCDGPPPPALDSFEIAIARAEDVCANRADLLLPREAEARPNLFTAAGCDNADPGVTCDLIGAFSPCEDLPICAGADVITNNCTAFTTAQSCCTVFLAPLCENCEPEVEFCRQECRDSPPFDTGPPTAPGPPVEFGAALACANDAASLLQGLADMNPDRFVVGCDDADVRVRCDIQSSVGSCEDNPACPADQIDQGSCTAATGPPSCCDVILERPCDGCDPIALQCLNVCASNLPAPEESAAELNNAQCIDDADTLTVASQMDGSIAPSCAAAERGEACVVEGAGGVCGTGSLCGDVEVRNGSSCSEPGTTAENGCCIALLAPPCLGPGCDPEPVDCLQTCS